MSGEAETTEMPETYFRRNQNVLVLAETLPETLVMAETKFGGFG